MKTKIVHTQSFVADNTPEGKRWVADWTAAWTRLGYSVIESNETTGSVFVKIWTMIEIGGDGDAEKTRTD